MATCVRAFYCIIIAAEIGYFTEAYGLDGNSRNDPNRDAANWFKRRPGTQDPHSGTIEAYTPSSLEASFKVASDSSCLPASCSVLA